MSRWALMLLAACVVACEGGSPVAAVPSSAEAQQQDAAVVNVTFVNDSGGTVRIGENALINIQTENPRHGAYIKPFTQPAPVRLAPGASVQTVQVTAKAGDTLVLGWLVLDDTTSQFVPRGSMDYRGPLSAGTTNVTVTYRRDPSRQQGTYTCTVNGVAEDCTV